MKATYSYKGTNFHDKFDSNSAPSNLQFSTPFGFVQVEFADENNCILESEKELAIVAVAYENKLTPLSGQKKIVVNGEIYLLQYTLEKAKMPPVAKTHIIEKENQPYCAFYVFETENGNFLPPIQF